MLKCTRSFPGYSDGNGRGRHRLFTNHSKRNVLSCMIDLHHSACTIVFNGRRQSSQPGNKFIIVSSDTSWNTAKSVDCGKSYCNHSGTPTSSLCIKFHQLIGDLKICRHIQVHGRKADSVFKFKAVNRNRFKNRIFHNTPFATFSYREKLSSLSLSNI